MTCPHESDGSPGDCTFRCDLPTSGRMGDIEFRVSHGSSCNVIKASYTEEWRA